MARRSPQQASLPTPSPREHNPENPVQPAAPHLMGRSFFLRKSSPESAISPLRVQDFCKPAASRGRHPISTSTRATMALQDTVLTTRTPVLDVTPRTDRDGDAVFNTLLSSIPSEEFNLLRSTLEPLELPRYQVLHESGA